MRHFHPSCAAFSKSVLATEGGVPYSSLLYVNVPDTSLTLRHACSGRPPGNQSVGGKAFVVDLSDTATLELITFASQLSKEMYPDID